MLKFQPFFAKLQLIKLTGDFTQSAEVGAFQFRGAA